MGRNFGGEFGEICWFNLSSLVWWRYVVLLLNSQLYLTCGKFYERDWKISVISYHSRDQSMFI
jgi:hypothetical protein